MSDRLPDEVQWVFERYEEQRRTASKAASDSYRLEPHLAEYEQKLRELRAAHAEAGRVHEAATKNTVRLQWLLEAACAKARVPVPESPEIPSATVVDPGVITPCRACGGQDPACPECRGPGNGTPAGGTPMPPVEADPPAEPERHGALFGARPEPKRIGLVTYAIQTIGLWLVPPVTGRHSGGAVHA